MLFTRILEAGDELSSKAKQTPRKTNCGHTSKSRVLDQEPGSDSNDEDIQGFVRITLISRLKQANTFTTECQNDLSPPPLRKCCLRPKLGDSKRKKMYGASSMGLWNKTRPKPILIGVFRTQCVLGHICKNSSFMPQLK